MDDSSTSRRRRRSTYNQAAENQTPPPRSTRNTSANANALLDESPYLSPSGRPIRQRSTVNLRNSPTTLSESTRPTRASISRTAKKEESSPFEDEEEEEYVDEEEAEEKVMPSRSRRSSARARQPQPVAIVTSTHQQQQQSKQQRVNPSPFKITLGARGRGASRAQKRARLADEEDAGWMPELYDEGEAQIVYSTVIAKIQSWLTSQSDTKLTNFFEKLPSDTEFEKPMTLTMIGQKITKAEYASTIDFEKDMLQLFYNARHYFVPGSTGYRGVLILQRMYQHMTQSIETAKEDITDDAIAKNYASLQFGPCEDQGEGQGEAPSQGEKVVVPFLRYKGQTISVGNFVHLSNPTDPSRPIIAQVFKTRREELDDGNKQDWITACWFLRPEQTKHPRSMVFWPDEALKTSQFVEHHVEDVLEMICVMYYTKFMKGRPVEGEGGWREGDPLYVCENRFHAEKEQFYKIKNWSGVMPEEVRNKKFDMIEFDQPMVQPTKVKSPFLLGSNGPGGIADENFRPSASAPTLIRSNSSFQGSGSGVATPTGGVGSGTLGSIPRPRGRPPLSASIPTTFGAPPTPTAIPQLFKEWDDEIQSQRKAYLKAKEEKAAAALTDQSANATAAAATAITTSNSPMKSMPPIAQATDRSVSNAMILMDVAAYYKVLPSETQSLFHQDAESGNVLWYPAPPTIGPSEVKIQRQWNNGEKVIPHSLDYLYYLATGSSSSSSSNNKTRKDQLQSRP